MPIFSFSKQSTSDLSSRFLQDSFNPGGVVSKRNLVSQLTRKSKGSMTGDEEKWSYRATQVALAPHQSQKLSMTIPITGRHQLLSHIHRTQKILNSCYSSTSPSSTYLACLCCRQRSLPSTLCRLRWLKRVLLDSTQKIEDVLELESIRSLPLIKV